MELGGETDNTPATEDGDTPTTLEHPMSPTLAKIMLQYPKHSAKDSRWKNLYNNEAGSDVIFLVGEPECWRFPAHIDVLCQYPVFDAMLREPWSKKGTPIHIPDDDPRAFDNLLKFMYRNEVELKSVTTAVETLGLANKYMCVDLVDECIVYLTRNLTVDSVLAVYRVARLYGGQAEPGRDGPPSPTPRAAAVTAARATAPPLHDLMPPAAAAAAAADDEHTEAFARMTRHYDTLMAYCAAFVDRNADRVMADEGVDELDGTELVELLRRDTLAVSNEMVLFAMLERWCTHKCKQQHLELTVANRRAVLDDAAVLSVRYLLMTANEFLSGPMPSGLLSAQEKAVLMKLILNPRHPKWTCQRLTEQKLQYMAVPRTRPASGVGLSYVIRRRSSSSMAGRAVGGGGGGGGGSRSSSAEFDSPGRSCWCSGGKKAKKAVDGDGGGKKNKKKFTDSCFCHCLMLVCFDWVFG